MLICEKYRKIIKVFYACHIIYYYILIGIQSIIQIIG